MNALFSILLFWLAALLLAAAAVVLSFTQLGTGVAALVLLATMMLGVRLIVAR
jgi:hypothetical protein